MRRTIHIRRSWRLRPPTGGAAAVLDVLRFSTTLCALLQAGRRVVRAAPDPRTLLRAPELERADIFSELTFRSPGRRFDNSPSRALSAGRSARPAYAVTTAGSKALWACRRSRPVLAGGFANFSALLSRLRRLKGPIFLVPAAGRGSPEDGLCAEALRRALSGDAGAAGRALRRLKSSPRPARFLRRRPGGRRDLALCLGLDRFALVPEARFSAGAPFAGIRRAR